MHKPGTLTHRITRTVALLSLFFGLSIGLILIVWDLIELKNSFEDRVNEVLSSMEKPAAMAAYNLETTLALEVARGLMEFEPVSYVQITNERYQTMVEMERFPGPLPFHIISSLFFKETYTYALPLRMEAFLDGTIGTLFVNISPHEIVHAFIKRASLIVGLALLQSCALALLVLFMVYHRVTRPLQNLSEDFYALDPQSSKVTRFQSVNYPRDKEFEKLTTAANRMLDTIRHQFAEKDAAKLEIKRQKEQTERYLAIAETLIIHTDTKGLITQINPLACQIFKDQENTLLAQNFFELAFSPSQRQNIQGSLDELLSLPKGIRHDQRVYSQSRLAISEQTDKLIYWQIGLHFDQSGLPIGYLISGQDVTRLEKAEEALKASEGNLRAIIDATTDGYGVLNLRTLTFVDLNPALADILGHRRDKVLFSSLLPYLHPEDRHLVLDALLAETSARDAPLSMRLLNSDKGHVPCEMKVSILKHNIGNEKLTVIFVRDISERLEQQKRHRLLEQKLRQAQKMETIGTLAGGIAHDFNNVLTPIFGYASLLLDKLSPDDPNRARVEKIHKSTQRATEMVNKILTFSKRNEQEMHSHLLGPLLEEALELIKSTCPNHIDLRLKLPKKEYPVLCDATQIQQMLINMATNALHAMEHLQNGILTIALAQKMLRHEEVELLPDLEKGPHMILLIKDNGHGMDQETLERLFDPFFTTKKNDKGTGLGMAMVHGIIKSHHGHIDVESTPGAGTTIRVLLPVTEQPIHFETQKTVATFKGQQEHILIVDDDPINTSFLEEVMQENGFSCQGFTDAQDALNFFMRDPHHFDMLLTDQTMPNIGGHELVKAIRTVRSDMPVIMISGYNQVVGGQNAKEFGIDAFMTKPVSIAQLTQTMDKLLHETRSK